MLIEFLPPSPKAGIQEHVSRETAAALFAAGFAKAVQMRDEDRIPSKDDVIPPKPPRGWEAGFFMWGAEKVLSIIFHDGQGGKMVYDGPPAPSRRWSAAEQRHVMVPADCPAEVIAQFHTLAGNEKEAAAAREKAERETRRNAEEAVARNKPGRYDAQVLAARLSR
jgi:hypothetical protein